MDPATIDHLFLITGTTRGIGKALVNAATQRPGSFVVSLSRADACLESNRQNICIDLNDTDRIAAALAAVQFDFSQCTRLKRSILINNAGVLDPIAPLVDGDDEQLAANIRVNLTAPLILARHFYRFSRGFAGCKWIVNITSGASQNPYYGWSAYGAAKAGLDMATRAMALEFARINPDYRVCAIAPGTVDTDMQTQIRRSTRQQFDRVDKFVSLKADGALSAPDHTAAALMRLLIDGDLENGGRYDLRAIDQTIG